jgi:hypothetical protein
MTQSQEILYRLQMGPVCGTDLLRMFIPRYAARILELRQAGHQIETRTCRDDRHQHRNKQIEYVLVTADTLF